MSQRVPCYEIMARGRGRQFPLVRPASSSHRWTAGLSDSQTVGKPTAGQPDSRTVGQLDSRQPDSRTVGPAALKPWYVFRKTLRARQTDWAIEVCVFSLITPVWSASIPVLVIISDAAAGHGGNCPTVTVLFYSAVQFPSVKRGLREESCVGMYSHLTSLDKTGKLSQLNRSVTAKLWN